MAGISGAVLTPQCAAGEHAACSHLCGWGGRFNPRRHRFEVGAPLCPCDCHVSCPVTPSGDRLTVPPDSILDAATAGLVASRAERVMMFGRAVTETAPAAIKDLYRLHRQAREDQHPPGPH